MLAPCRTAGRKRRRKEKHKAREPLPAPRTEPVQKERSRPVFSLRDGRYNLLWVALFALGLSGGLYFSKHIHSQPLTAAPAPPAVHRDAPVVGSQVRADAASAVSLPDERSRAPSAVPESNPIPAKSAAGTTPDIGAGIHSKRRLQGKSSLVILGIDAPTVEELSKHPSRLPELVQDGSLFTAPRGAAVEVQETANGVLKVLVLEGSMAGREGWVPGSQVTR